MRSPPWRPPISVLVALACVLVGGTGVAWLRPGLAADYHRVHTLGDVYALPSPEQTVVLSLGYRAALADYLFAHVLVSYGLHVQERERFEFAGNYFDVVNALVPTFRTPYQLADTVLTLQSKPARVQDYEKARQVLERGMVALPYDGEIWLTAGQFIAYLAPGHLGSRERDESWRKDGARVLSRACELVGTNESLPYQCITAASILSEQGEREALIRMLERFIAVNQQNPEQRDFAIKVLGKYGDAQRMEQARDRFERFRVRWHADLPFVGVDTELVVGPPFEPFACAGQSAVSVRGGRPDCATTWRRWVATAP
jgi:tetratricopeptide (TPR) repeat protein